MSGCVSYVIILDYLKYLYSAVFGGVEARVLGMALGSSGHAKPGVRKAGGGALNFGFTGGGNATAFGITRAGAGGAADFRHLLFGKGGGPFGKGPLTNGRRAFADALRLCGSTYSFITRALSSVSCSTRDGGLE